MRSPTSSELYEAVSMLPRDPSDDDEEYPPSSTSSRGLVLSVFVVTGAI
jgi:hypothetical protein